MQMGTAGIVCASELAVNWKYKARGDVCDGLGEL